MRPVVLSITIGLMLVLCGRPDVIGAAELEPAVSSLQDPPVAGLVPPDPPVGLPAPSVDLELGPPSPLVKQPAPDDGSDAVGAERAPAPVELTGPVTSAASLALVPTSPATLLAIAERPEVQHFLERFRTSRRAIVQEWLGRAGRYLAMARGVFAGRDLPEDLVYTAMIESGFNTLAVSRAGAKGLWQFMAPTARRYGLRVDRWLDERLDPEKATVAAARYFKDLYATFGSWPLVHAAYNAGEGRVQRALQGTGASDFWQLSRSQHLRDETKLFVAAVQAAALIGREPERYGLMVAPEPPLQYDVVRTPPGTTLRRVAAQSGVSESTLRELNPQLRLQQTPPGEIYPLKVPVGTGPRVTAALDPGHRVAAAAPAKPRAGVHVVRRQETVGSIARLYGVPPAAILQWNRLDETARIHPGDRLRVAALAGDAREGGQGGAR